MSILTHLDLGFIATWLVSDKLDMTPQEMFALLQSSEEGRAQLQQFGRSLHADDYDEFLDVLYKKLDDIFAKLECSRDKHFSHDEDAITGVIAGRLEEAGYRASEQTKQNGAVDLTVQLDDYKWIAEAKIAYSNSKILEGLIQLLTRYTTRDTNGGLLVYMKKPNSKKVVDDWDKFLNSKKKLASYISKKNPEVRDDLGQALGDITTNRLSNTSLDSMHTLVSGTPITVRHFCADLYFNPGDASGNTGKKQRLDNAMNNLTNLYFEHLESGAEFDSEKCLEYLERLLRDVDPDDSELEE
ncbi:hypothetical protein BCU39_008410 [Vibrio cyclitrophicus]|uniref:hypothetical protein n=1 Tax=Vibrio cyclitrophicus TaxID=47951 RepID=UPI0018E43CDA|nr:hypothetical protein [Vibrio cyclitrophicus]